MPRGHLSHRTMSRAAAVAIVPGAVRGHPPSLLLTALLLPGSRAGQLPALRRAPSRHRCSMPQYPLFPPPPLPGPAAPSPPHRWFHCSSSSSRPSTSPTPPTGPRSSCRHIPRVSSRRASRRSPAAARGCWLSAPWGARRTSPSRTRKTITTWTTEVRTGGSGRRGPRGLPVAASPAAGNTPGRAGLSSHRPTEWFRLEETVKIIVP